MAPKMCGGRLYPGLGFTSPAGVYGSSQIACGVSTEGRGWGGFALFVFVLYLSFVSVICPSQLQYYALSIHEALYMGRVLVVNKTEDWNYGGDDCKGTFSSLSIQTNHTFTSR